MARRTGYSLIKTNIVEWDCACSPSNDWPRAQEGPGPRTRRLLSVKDKTTGRFKICIYEEGVLVVYGSPRATRCGLPPTTRGFLPNSEKRAFRLPIRQTAAFLLLLPRREVFAIGIVLKHACV